MAVGQSGAPGALALPRAMVSKSKRSFCHWHTLNYLYPIHFGLSFVPIFQPPSSHSNVSLFCRLCYTRCDLLLCLVWMVTGSFLGRLSGTYTRARTCTSPVPSYGGAPCSGETEETGVCTLACYRFAKQCPGSSSYLAPAPNPYGLPGVQVGGSLLSHSVGSSSTSQRRIEY